MCRRSRPIRDFELVATASRHGRIEGVPAFPDIETLLEKAEGLDAVALCMPPGPRHAAALTALRAGKHVLLEKPPGATLSELDDLVALAERQRVCLFATWHSRFAAGVAAARDWLAGRTIRSVRVDWKEDVRRWHPGQAWIWEPGGFGVFDPGINALSIVTEILPMPIHLTSATLLFPQNRAQPIAADLVFADAAGGERATATFDWRQTGPQTWDIHVSTDDGDLSAAVRRRETPHPRHAGCGRPRRRVCAHLQPIREADRGGRERRRPASAASCRRRLHGRPARFHGCV